MTTNIRLYEFLEWYRFISWFSKVEVRWRDRCEDLLDLAIKARDYVRVMRSVPDSAYADGDMPREIAGNIDALKPYAKLFCDIIETEVTDYETSWSEGERHCGLVITIDPEAVCVDELALEEAFKFLEAHIRPRDEAERAASAPGSGERES